uniref:Putative chitin binding peritrophin-a domain protein n=1 Tax=Anopheles triannulatus TaxID=58253 RepID=A0A2M4A8N1_9DIPT
MSATILWLCVALLALLQPMVKSMERSSSERIQRSLPHSQSQLHAEEAKQSWEAGSIADPFGSTSIENNNYQGLVGRPGIDFPVLTHIPRTVFECENHGNGYFADLEARCQVFHICDEGKKISFLCPNGTIFRQLDLICDWWFKVDCASTPNHYAESTEMLSLAKRARLQSKHPVPQPIHEHGGSLKIDIQNRDKFLLKDVGWNRHADSANSFDATKDSLTGNESNGSGSRVRKGRGRKLSASQDEIQDTAQTASFASIVQKMFNSYHENDQKASKVKVGQSGDDVGRENIGKEQSRKDTFKIGSRNHSVNYIPYTTARKLNLGSKVAQFYTPTVPSIPARTVAATIGDGGGIKADRRSDDDSLSYVRGKAEMDESVMDHAMEIMKTIKSLKVGNPQNEAAHGDYATLMRDADPMQMRNQLVAFPTSSAMRSVNNILHLPASRNQETDSKAKSMLSSAGYGQTRSSKSELAIDVGHRSLLTHKTLKQYDRLFNSKQEEDGNDVYNVDNSTSYDQHNVDQALEHDLEGQSSRYPAFGMSNASQIRELAQVFTHALSAYLQDPVTFRRILTEIRPKAPMQLVSIKEENSIDGILEKPTNLPNIGAAYYTPLRTHENFEVLDFSDITTPIPSTYSPFVESSTTPLPTSLINPQRNVQYAVRGTKEGKSLSIQFINNQRNELADEVNGELGTQPSSNHGGSHSQQTKTNTVESTATGTPVKPIYNRLVTYAPVEIETTSYRTSFTSEAVDSIPSPESILKPPRRNDLETLKTTLPLEEEEQLQRSQSGSIFSSFQQNMVHNRNVMEKYNIVSLENSGNSLTSIGNQSEPENNDKKDNQTLSNQSTPVDTRTTKSYTVFFDPLTINDELMAQFKVNPTQINPTAERLTIATQSNDNMFNSKISSGTTAATTPTSHDSLSSINPVSMQDYSGMQKKANEMFGNLDDEQVDKLMHAMKMADKNKSMRRLILLLIRTCDDDTSTANEESRKALLDALMNIDGERTNSERFEMQNHRRGKQIGTRTTSQFLRDVSAKNVFGMESNYSNYNEADDLHIDGESVEQRTSTYATQATSFMQYLSSESHLLNENEQDDDNQESTAYTTTTLPTTPLQTTVDYTTAETTTIATVDETTTRSDKDGLLATTTFYTDTPHTSAESLESTLSNFQRVSPESVNERYEKDLSDSIGHHFPVQRKKKQDTPHHSDTRALELLKSLYTLAARWG